MLPENLRREARIDARIKVSVVRGRNLVSLETSDVSFKGLFLCTAEPPPVRSLLRLRVSLPVREIEAHAMAIHVSKDEADGRSSGVGVQFWGLAGPDRTAWDDFVRDLIQARRAAAKSLAEASSGATPSVPPSSVVRPVSELPGSPRAQQK
jgi:hypothetical protein